MPGPTPAEVISAQLAQRKLPQKAVRLRREYLGEQLQNAPSDAIQQELTPGNISELLYELQRTTDPKAKAVLQAEYERLRSLAENLQPFPNPNPAPKFQTMPLTPEMTLPRPPGMVQM